MSFELSNKAKAVVEIGGVVGGEELLRAQIIHFAQSQILPIIEKFQSQGTQVVLEKIHEAGKTFWWEVVVRMSNEISPESLHLAKLARLFAVPLIARMSEVRVMKDVKIVNALRFIALFLIAVSPTYFELAQVIHQYAHQYPALELAVNSATVASGILIGGEYILSLFEIISSVVIKRGEMRDAEDEQRRTVNHQQSDLQSRQDEINRRNTEKANAKAEEATEQRRKQKEEAQKKAEAKQALLQAFQRNYSPTEAVRVGRAAGMSDKAIYYILMKATHSDTNPGVSQAMPQDVTNLYNKREERFEVT